MSRTRCYRAGVLSDEDFPLADVSEHLDDPDAVVWVDMCAPNAEELRVVADELGLHELAVEDALHERQRPKLDLYPDHSFLSTYSKSYDVSEAALERAEAHATGPSEGRERRSHRRSQRDAEDPSGSDPPGE